MTEFEGGPDHVFQLQGSKSFVTRNWTMVILRELFDWLSLIIRESQSNSTLNITIVQFL